MRRGLEDFIRTHSKKLLRDESGATAIEYGLLAAFVFLILIASVSKLGTALSPVFAKVSDNL